MEHGSKKRTSMDPSARFETAADWLQRLDDPQLKEKDIQAWLEWFSACDANRNAFEELQALRRRFREMPENYRDALKGRMAADSRSSSGRSRWRQRVLALAASVCAAALGLGVWWNVQTNVVTATYAAPAHQHRTVTLQDGSSVVLAAEAIVDVAYSRERRALNIQRGAAYFEVRKDFVRPFIVEAGGVRVTAVGTAFNVQRTADDVTVTVTEGQVSISGGAGSLPSPAGVGAEDARGEAPPSEQDVLLRVGQRLVLPLANDAGATSVVAAGPESQWEDNRAAFIDAPLSEVLPVINPYASAQLVIDDPRVADLTYTGTIFRDHIDEWVASLPRIYAIRAVPIDDGTITLVSQ